MNTLTLFRLGTVETLERKLTKAYLRHLGVRCRTRLPPKKLVAVPIFRQVQSIIRGQAIKLTEKFVAVRCGLVSVAVCLSVRLQRKQIPGEMTAWLSLADYELYVGHLHTWRC